MNKISITGRLVADPEIRIEEGKTPYARFTVAVRRPYHAEGKQDCDFIRVVCFNHRAIWLARNEVAKGTKLEITGALHISTYTDREKVKRTSAEIVAAEIEYAESRKAARPQDIYAEYLRLKQIVEGEDVSA